jgi:autotransporter translocation and assembly factor TamB
MSLYPEQEKSVINFTGGIKINGTAVTATAANLNAVPTATGTGAEIDAASKQSVQGADGIHPLQVAVATFDASIAGNQTIAAHGLGVTLPQYAIVVGGFFDVNTVFHSAGADAGTIAISVAGANDIQTAAAVSGAPYSTINRKAIVPKSNTPESTAVKATVASEITATVAGQVLSSGKLTVYLYFVCGKASA